MRRVSPPGVSDTIEFDDTYFGGPAVGRKRGAEKAKVFAAVSLDERGNPRYAKMQVTLNIKQASVKKFAQAAFAQGSNIHSDGYRSYVPALESYTHEHKPYDPNSGLLHWLHIVISSAKALIQGTYHGLPKKYLQAYGVRTPVEFMLSAGNDHDSVHAVELLKKVKISGSNVLCRLCLWGKTIRAYISEKGASYVIPP